MNVATRRSFVLLLSLVVSPLLYSASDRVDARPATYDAADRSTAPAKINALLREIFQELGSARRLLPQVRKHVYASRYGAEAYATTLADVLARSKVTVTSLQEVLADGLVVTNELSPKPPRATKHVMGLQNYGFTCYLNVIFNALAWNPQLTPLLDAKQPLGDVDKERLRTELRALVQLLRRGSPQKGAVVDPRKALEAIAQWQGKSLSSINQYTDTAEVLFALFDLLGKGDERWITRYRQLTFNHGIVSSAPSLQTPMISLALGNEGSSLQQLLDGLQEKSPVEGLPIEAQMLITTPALALTIQLLRATCTPEGGCRKNHQPVTLDPTITLNGAAVLEGKTIAEDQPFVPPRYHEQHRYTLQGAILHLGDHPSSGHFVYVSYPNQFSKSIHVHNDHQVIRLGKTTREGGVVWDQSLVEKNAVVLFYRQ